MTYNNSRRRKTSKSRRYKRKHSNKKRTQKMYNMTGCSHKYKCKCKQKRRFGGSSPIGALQIHGGGNSAFVGEPYSIDKGGNYYGPMHESGGFDYRNQMQLRGGGLIPDNMKMFMGNMAYGAKSLYNGVTGYKAPVDPSPWKEQGMMYR